MNESTIKRLKRLAMSAAKNAYCPYSHFAVGCALLADDGKVYQGCNVENASYGLTICAERNALFQMISGGGGKAKLIVIYTKTAEPSTPCGACRQVIWEFGKEALIVCCGQGKEFRGTASELLVHPFGPVQLGKRKR